MIVCLQFKFKKAHVARLVNSAADFLSRLELKVTEKVRLKMWEDIQTTPIEVTTSSSDVAGTIFLHTSRSKHESEEKTLEPKKTIKTKCEATGSKRGTTLLQNKCERIYKDRWKHHVVFHDGNQSKCTNMGRARWRSCVKEYGTEKSRHTT